MRRLASGEPIVICVGSDPEPEDAISGVDRQCAIVRAHACGVKTANSFEMQGRVLRIGLKELELLVGKGPDLFWQLMVGAPETRSRIMVQSFFERPAR